MITLEVKVEGLARNKNVEHEVMWLDWDEFPLIPTSKRAGSHRRLVSNGKQAFQILRAKARERYLIKHDLPGKWNYFRVACFPEL